MQRLFTILIHIALAIILAGAIVTHYCGVQGELVLSQDSASATTFKQTSGPGDGRFPFEVEFKSAAIEYYPGTTTPMDFRSELVVDGQAVTVSMNNVAQVDGWRFFQSGISPDSTRLNISYDPWGVGITYVGYALLLLGMAGFFCQRRSAWRALLRAGRRAVVVLLLLVPICATAAPRSDLPVMQRPLASNLGKAYVYWNDRICPMQTMACDVAKKLYGTKEYGGFTPEQVLSGWLFYYDTWERDYRAVLEADAPTAKAERQRNERAALVRWLGTGEAFKVYPYKAVDGHIEWLSLTGRRPSGMDLSQWEFMQTTMPRIKMFLLEGRNVAADSVVTVLIDKQIEYAGVGNLPTSEQVLVERFMNSYVDLLFPAVVALLLGVFYLYVAVRAGGIRRLLAGVVAAVTWLLAAYVFAALAMLWWIGGHVPLSNGPEMMLFMSLFALVCTLVVRNRLLRGAFLCVAAMTLFVGVMGGRSPRIGMLMPVLASPLLSVHVMLVMTSYVFFMIMAVLSAIGLATKRAAMVSELSRINRVILVPAVFLLAAGIFVGAVWANQSWGRYWGWDPKETCALITMFVYAVPMHWSWRRLGAFRKPKVLHVYLLLAILSVLFTYFGANYLLPGLHSYA